MAKFDLVVAAKTVGAGSIKRLGNSMQGVAGRIKNLRLAMGGLNKTFATFGLIISGGAFVGLVKGAIDSADAFGKMSDQTGIAANTLQAYVNAGKLAGVSQETIDKGLRRLAQSMREADQGVATYKDSFDALGISVRTIDGTFKTSQQVLGEIADRFANIENGSTKAAIAMEIFGRSGASLINLLNGGAASLEEFNYEVSENFAQNAEFFNDQIAVLGIRFDGFRKQLTDALLPALNTIVGVFSELFSAENDFSGFFKAIEIGIRGIAIGIFATIKLVDETVRVIENLGKKFKNFFDNLVAGIPPFILKMIGGVGGAVGDLGKAFVDQQGSNFSSLMGEDFMSGFNERFTESFNKIQELFSGETNAPAEYTNKITTSVDSLNESMDRTFGGDMKNKLNSFKDSLKTVGESMGDVVVKGIKGMEDALVNFVTTGKMNFRDLANSIIKDMARIAIQQTITAPFTKFLGGLFNADGNAFDKQGLITAYAKGGVVDKPTFFRYGGAGKLGVQATGGGTSVVVNVDASGSNVQGDEAEGRQLGSLIAAAVQGEILKQQRPGGLLAGTA